MTTFLRSSRCSALLHRRLERDRPIALCALVPQAGSRPAARPRRGCCAPAPRQPHALLERGERLLEATSCRPRAARRRRAAAPAPDRSSPPGVSRHSGHVGPDHERASPGRGQRQSALTRRRVSGPNWTVARASNRRRPNVAKLRGAVRGVRAPPRPQVDAAARRDRRSVLALDAATCRSRICSPRCASAPQGRLRDGLSHAQAARPTAASPPRASSATARPASR